LTPKLGKIVPNLIWLAPKHVAKSNMSIFHLLCLLPCP